MAEIEAGWHLSRACAWQGYGPVKAVLLTPLFFGVAHLHHAYDFVVHQGCTVNSALVMVSAPTVQQDRPTLLPSVQRGALPCHTCQGDESALLCHLSVSWLHVNTAHIS